MGSASGGIVLKDDQNSTIEMDGEGKIEISNSHGLGISVYKFSEDDSIMYNINSNLNTFTKSGSKRDGFMMRFQTETPDKLMVPEIPTNTLGVDDLIHEIAGSDFITGAFPLSEYVSVPNSGEFKNFTQEQNQDQFMVIWKENLEAGIDMMQIQ